MFGAVIGDLIGSGYQANRQTDSFFSPECHISDNTLYTVVLADALLNKKTLDVSLDEWSKKHPTHLPFLSPNTSATAPQPTKGCIMNLSPVPFLINDPDTAIKTAVHIASLTGHYKNKNAVRAYVLALHMFLNRALPFTVGNTLAYYYEYPMHRHMDEIRLHCAQSGADHHMVPETISCVLQADSFETALQNALSLGGDSPVLACMTGALAEARFGIPKHIQQDALPYIPTDIKNTLADMYRQPITRNVCRHRHSAHSRTSARER